jgi:hypothetical protein
MLCCVAVMGATSVEAWGQAPLAPPSPRDPAPPRPMTEEEQRDHIAGIMADLLAQRHGQEYWQHNRALRTDLTLEFVGQKPISGTLTVDIPHGRAIFEMIDNRRAIFNGAETWIAPASIEIDNAEARLLTWSQALMAPFTLRDRGYRLAQYRSTRLEDLPHDTFMVRIDRQVKPAAQGWWLMIIDPESRLLKAMVFEAGDYVAGSEAGLPPSQAIALYFDEYRTIGGTNIATRWTFYKWNNGREGEPIGQATLSEPRYVVLPQNAFDKPESGRLASEPRPQE